MSTPSVINVGLIGLKSDTLAWNEIDGRMHGRTRVAAVWDAVTARTAVVEREGDRRDGDRRHQSPAVYRSVSKLAARRALDACVVLAPGWSGLWSARRIADEGVPVLWLANWPTGPSDDESPWAFAGVGRDLITPGLRLRYLPATLRLRELIATEMGDVQSVAINLGSQWPKWELVDWSKWITSTRSRRSDLEVQVSYTSENDLPEKNRSTQAVIECEHGTAEWTPDSSSASSSLRWRSHDQPDWSAVETSRDRTAEDVLLDLFFRRVAGGLIPLPSVDDVETAICNSISAD